MRGNIRDEEKKMKVEKRSYENPSVDSVVANVRAGIRSKADLEFCGCPVCREALKILGGEKKDDENKTRNNPEIPKEAQRKTEKLKYPSR